MPHVRWSVRGPKTICFECFPYTSIDLLVVVGEAVVGLPPDFLSSLLALASFMRLSLTKAAHANLFGAACRKSGSARLFRPTYAPANVGHPSSSSGLTNLARTLSLRSVHSNSETALSRQSAVQQNQRFRQHTGALRAIGRFCPFFGRMASTIFAGHKDHTHRRYASDEHAIVPGPAGQAGAADPGSRWRFLDRVLHQWRTDSGQCLAQQR